MLRSLALPTPLLAFFLLVADSAAHAAPSPSCALADLALTRFPLDGVAGRDWVITNYVDLDPSSPGVADYTGNRGPRARTYDGHTGVDIDVSSFREMDAEVAVIHAAASGVVDQVIDDQPDRNQRCAGRWNVVAVRHDSGFRVLYGHIKAHSARVAVGQRVAAGTPLAVVGSAGCSPQPHLHLEVRDCAGAPVETLQTPETWLAPPPYDPASDVMDVMIREGALAGVADIKDPGPDPTTVAPGTLLGVGLSASVRGGDTVAVTLAGSRGPAAPRERTPSGAPPTSTTRTFTLARDARYGHWYLGFTFTAGAAPGRWTITVSINGAPRTHRRIDVASALSQRPPAPPGAACSRRSSTGRAGGWRPRTDRSRPAF